MLTVLSACSSAAKHADVGVSVTSSKNTSPASAPMTVDARFQTYQGSSTVAATYDRKQVPPGAKAKVTVTVTGKSTEVALRVTGLQAGRVYGAHLHKKSCGAKPADAGSHYQNTSDPEQPSTNPRFANPSNEVWLDFTTDADGVAQSKAVVPFLLRAGADGPHSLVIHARHTMTAAGKAGTAGTRLACVNLAG